MQSKYWLLLVYLLLILNADNTGGDNSTNLTASEDVEVPVKISSTEETGIEGWDWYKIIPLFAAVLAIIGKITGFFSWINKIVQTKVFKNYVRDATTEKQTTIFNAQIPVKGDVHGNIFSGQFNAPVNVHESDSPPRLPLQKPPHVSNFVGREEELASIMEDLLPGRVITLCGPGGIGKTALASEVIWHLAPENEPPERFPDGIIFHPFYRKPDAALALEAIARAYGEDPRPSPAEAARRVLSGRKALLVLDGAEATEDLNSVLDVSGSCGVLITSRRHQDAPSEWQDLPPLPLEKAVQLLQAWGGYYASNEASADRICELLGGLPLAVFLAGRYMAQRCQQADDYLAWLETTPLEALNLGERRHQSVPLLIQRSLEQVSESSQEALCVSGVLALEPFESQLVAVALDIEPYKADRSLGELVNYGIMSRPDARYLVVHALLHTYARERLDPAREMLNCLAEYYASFAQEQSKLGLAGYASLDLQRSHILAVQSACLAKSEWEAVRSLTWAINDYLDMQGHWTERAAAVEAGLEAARADGSRHDEAAFLNLLGWTKDALGKTRRAIEFYEQALKISREIGDRRIEGKALGHLGVAYTDLGEARRAVEFHEQALMISREICDFRDEEKALGNLGLAYSELGESRRAIELHEQALKISREIDDRRCEGVDLSRLGLAYADLGETRRAIELYEQSLKIFRDIGDFAGEERALGNLGIAYSELGEIRRAIELHEEALKISRDIGYRRGEERALGNLGIAYSELGETHRAIELHKEALNISREIGDRRDEGRDLGNLGLAYVTLGETSRAIKFLEQYLDISREIGDHWGEGDALACLGLAYAALGETRKAIEFQEQALENSQDIGNLRGEGDALWNISQSLENLGDHVGAIEFASAAHDIYKQIESPYAEQVRLKLDKWLEEKVTR